MDGQKYCLVFSKGLINTVRWSRDGRFIITASNDDSIKVLDFTTKQTIYTADTPDERNFLGF